ncbi:MAG: extracellular solute-binding protein [Anaerohalosphaera sp.]|nr:extracellular solute-binding protein [Anaerohalosphaera sp.]
MDTFRGIVWYAVLGGVLFGLSSCKSKESPAGQVVVYCSVDQAVAEPIFARFEEQSGIKVLARFDIEASKTVGLVQKIRAEKSQPAADVFWSSEIFYTIRLGQEGLLEPFDNEDFANWPGTFVDKKKLWHAFGLRARVIAYNTEKVSAEDAPASLEEILDVKWKGRVVMARPSFGTTGGDVASWFTHYGSERAVEILHGLKENEIRIVSGNSTAVRMVASGQVDVCFTDTDDVYAGKRNGWPVEMKILDQAGAGTLSIPNTAAIVKGSPNRENAEAMMSFLLGGDAEEMLLKSDSHNWPIVPEKIGCASEFAEYEISKPLDIEYEQVAADLQDALKKAGEILN